PPTLSSPRSPPHPDLHSFPTRRSSDLLRVFVSNPDRVLTQRTLLVMTLGPAYEDAVDNLRTFVNQLRRKVERDPARPQRIVTERSEEHTSELQSRGHLVCRLLLEKKK